MTDAFVLTLSSGAPREPMRVTVVDDSAADRAELLRLLQADSERRYLVVEAPSCLAGIRAVLGAPDGLPDVVLLDHDLTDRPATELLAALAGPDGLPRCAVVVITGRDDDDAGGRVLRAGAQDHIARGTLTAGMLRRSVDNAVERLTLRRQLHRLQDALRERALRDAFFVELSQALRSIADPAKVKLEATERLGRHLKASRVVYVEVMGPERVVLEPGYVDGVAALDGAYRLKDYGQHLYGELAAGRNIVVADVQDDLAYSADEKLRYAQIRLVANLSVPLLRDGRLAAVLAVYHDRPRHWSPAEIALVEETAERTWQAVNRAQADAWRLESEHRQQLALEAGTMGVWRWNPTTQESDVDPAERALTGLDEPLRERSWGDVFMERIDPRDLPQVQADIERVMREGGRFRHEFRYAHPDGRTLWLAGQAMVVETDAFGRHLVGVNFDVTERKRAEIALGASQNRLAQLIQVMPSFTAVLRGPEHVFELCNPPYYQLVGRDERILGKPVLQALPEIADQPFPALLDRVYATGEPFEAKGMSVWLARGDGGPLEHMFIDFSYTPLREDDGTTSGILVHGHDRTDQVHAEQALRRSQIELQTLADNTPDILTRFDRKRRYVFINAAIERATGLPPEHFLGRSNREIGMPAEFCDRWDEALDRVFETGVSSDLDFMFAGPEGPRYFSARLVPEAGAEGRIEHVLGVTRDTTDSRRSERLLREADRRKDEFLATLAHELRNPLAPIRNGLAILRKDTSARQVERIVPMMERQLTQLINLVDDLLDLSRVSLDKIELKIERLSVDESIAAAVEACRPAVDAKQHALTIDWADEPLFVDADRTRLVQIIANLLTNAAKYTEPRGSIRIQAGREGEQVVIRVHDSGVGIAPEVLPTLWSLFTQVRDTIDKAQGGLGIGLSLVKKLAEMHGGSVWAASEGLGRGSVFSVRLPLALGPAPIRVPSAAVAVAPAASRRVLVVDDNEDSAHSLAMLLESMEHATAVAHSGLDALARASDFRPEVILLDIGLPDMDGYEVARLLRLDRPQGGPLLVAVTGWGSDEDRRRAKLAGFDHHLTKPVQLSAIEALLTRSAMR